MGLFDSILRSDTKVRGTGIKDKRKNDLAELKAKRDKENEERRQEDLKGWRMNGTGVTIDVEPNRYSGSAEI